MKDALIDISGISFSTGGQRILHDISFQVLACDFLCVVGPNGSGKTTLVRCICRMLDSWKGNIRVNGKDIREYSRRELAMLISYVPQMHGTEFPFTVYEFVSMGRYPYHTAYSSLSLEDKAIIQKSLDSAGIGEFEDRFMNTLSGGEKQKAYIAAALAQNTGILVLDEPATYLDIRHQAELAALLKKLNQDQGYTIICITHDINTAVTMGNRVLGLKEGEMAFCKHISEIRDAAVFQDLFGIDFRFVKHSGGPAPVFMPGRY